MDQAFKVGLAIGAGVAAILVIMIMLMQKSRTKSSYDERQRLARGRAYRAGFYTLMAYMFLYGVTDALELIWCDTLTGLLLGIIAGTASFSITAIHNDAFIGMNEKIRSWSLVSLIIGALNLAVGIVYAVSGYTVGARGLTFYSINFFVAGLFALIYISLIIRNSRSGQSEDDEE